jgi:hypothetical protein
LVTEICELFRITDARARTGQDIGTLVDWVEENLDGLAGQTSRKLVKSIRADLKNFREVTPEELIETLGPRAGSAPASGGWAEGGPPEDRRGLDRCRA